MLKSFTQQELLSKCSSAKAWDNGLGGKWHWCTEKIFTCRFPLSPFPHLNHEKQTGIYCHHPPWHFWHIGFSPPAFIPTTISIQRGEKHRDWGEFCRMCSRHWVLSDSSPQPGKQELLDCPESRFWLCCVTAGNVFELSFPSPLNGDDKIELTVVVRVEPGNVHKQWPHAWPMNSVHRGGGSSLLLLDC